MKNTYLIKNTYFILLIHILFFTFCKGEKQRESINLADFYETLSMVFSFSNATVFTSYIFTKIYEFLDICTTLEGEKLKINCIFDFRFKEDVKTSGTCEKSSGKVFPLRLQNCYIQLSGQNIYAEVRGTVELSKLSVYHENLILQTTSKTWIGYIQIISTISQIFLIESETIRYFKISGSINLSESFINVSEITARDDGIQTQIKFENSSIEVKGCVNQNIQISSKGFVNFSENGCAQGGVITKDGEEITIIGGKIQYGNESQECPQIHQCPIIQF